MAQVTFTIADNVVARVLDAVANTTGWTSASGLTKAQWAQKYVADYIKAIVVSYEARNAGTTAEETQRTNSTNEIVIT